MRIEPGLPSSTKSVGPSEFCDALSIVQLGCWQCCPLAVPTLGAIDLSSAHDVRNAGSGHRRDRQQFAPSPECDLGSLQLVCVPTASFCHSKHLPEKPPAPEPHCCPCWGLRVAEHPGVEMCKPGWTTVLRNRGALLQRSERRNEASMGLFP